MIEHKRARHTAKMLGLEPEDALAVLMLLDNKVPTKLGSFSKEIAELQEYLASQEIDKILSETK